MHCVLLGVVRTLISLWFDSKNHKERWYVYQNADASRMYAINSHIYPPPQAENLVSLIYYVFVCLTFRYIGNRILEAESRLASVKPPSSFTRIPRAFRGRGWKGVYHSYDKNDALINCCVFH